MKNASTKNLVFSGLFIALGLLFPFFTAQIPSIGSKLLPMHIPVLLCGFFCGWPYGLIVGFITPLFRSVLFSMPPMFPTAVAMAFELAAYGFLTGLFMKLFAHNKAFTYLTLILAMIGGRIVWGIVSVFLYGISGSAFTIKLFIAGAFVNAIPGIIIQILIIPPIVIALKREKTLENAV